MWGREAKPDLTGKQTLKYPIWRQGAVNIPARGSEALEQEDNGSPRTTVTSMQLSSPPAAAAAVQQPLRLHALFRVWTKRE
jgi:hypothetical protein